MNEEPQGKTPIVWIIAAIGLVLSIVLVTCVGGASAQERSPAPLVEQVVLTVWRCQPNMAVRIENQGNEAMTRPGWLVWEGELGERIDPIAAGYSVFRENITAKGAYLITYGDGSLPPQTQSVRCFNSYVFMPILTR